MKWSLLVDHRKYDSEARLRDCRAVVLRSCERSTGHAWIVERADRVVRYGCAPTRDQARRDAGEAMVRFCRRDAWQRLRRWWRQMTGVLR